MDAGTVALFCVYRVMFGSCPVPLLPTDADIRQIPPEELLRLWSMTEVRVLIRGHADLAQTSVPVLHKLRGAMGRYMAIGASDQAVAGAPCPFQPPCGYALLHNDLPGPFRDGRLPKPFVPMLDTVGEDLMVTFRLFGNAGHWAQEFRAAMVAACRMGLDRARMEPLTLPVDGTDIRDHPLPPLPDRWKSVSLATLTPLVQRSDAPVARGKAPDLRPVLTGLRFRAEGLALWHGLRPGINLPALQAEAARLAAGAAFRTGHRYVPVRRGAEEPERNRQGWVGSVTLPAPAQGSALRALLWLAMVTHIGADTTIGAGRISLTLQV